MEGRIMAYVKIENNKVVQKQPNEENGFVKVHDDITCGMVHDGSESYAKSTFTTPAPVYDLAQELKHIRDDKIYGGITVNSLALQTDETTQSRITGMVVKAERDSNFGVNWSIGGGQSVTLNAAEIIAIGDAVVDHIQKCFDAYLAVDASTASDLADLKTKFDTEFANS